MKRRFIHFISVCLFFTVSCQKEEDQRVRISTDGMLESPLVSFKNSETKCVESQAETFLGETMFVTESGDTLYVSAYLSDMDDLADTSAVLTKSTLIGSSNFGTADGYNSFKLDVYKEGESTIYQSVDKSKTSTAMSGVTISYHGGSSEYKWSFDKSYYWPTDGKALNFCSYGPVSEFGSSGHVSNMTWNKDTHALSFQYTTPSASADTLDAQNQKDIIAGVNQQTYSNSGDNHVVLSLTHPLMAVRFVLGDLYGKIEYISLNNFNSVGTATVKSSGVVWSSLSTPKTYTQTFNMFDATKYTDAQKAAGTVELDQTSKKTRNFIIIPQVLPDNASMDLKMGNNLHPITLSFKKIGDGFTTDWSGFAGKVVTFRVSSQRANLVSVDITDTVSGRVKNNIKISNDGKSDIYVRAVLVGNWLNSKGNILASWDENLPYGKFDDKNPLSDASAFPRTLPSGWVYNESDGFYYYKKILPSGYRISQNLFNKFELTDKPSVENSSDPDVQLASFELAILVQAVAAVVPYGETDIRYSAKTAWGLSDTFLQNLSTTEKDTGAKND